MPVHITPFKAPSAAAAEEAYPPPLHDTQTFPSLPSPHTRREASNFDKIKSAPGFSTAVKNGDSTTHFTAQLQKVFENRYCDLFFAKMTATELRQHIYYFVMEDEFRTVSVGKWDLAHWHANVLPPLCRTSQGVFNDAVPVYIANCTFTLTNWHGNVSLSRFLDSVPKGIESVRALAFTSFQHFPGVGAVRDERTVIESADLALMKKCTGLLTVKLTMHVSKLVKRAAEEGSEYMYEPRAVCELVEFYALGDILECRNLKEVHFDGISNSAFDSCCVPPRDVLGDLAAWIVGEFEKRGQEVATRIVWRDWSYGSFYGFFY
ncbi:hypothetical protein BDV95DRAFT_646999 [Massariosphaeria phaeospora]|uniref:Uncharacterized protein n=1 Tax=Massariosphaeria phaeospora TaxID=100035 RepID=A0A7C8MHL3_9PLEO|nr:hypothetical protein BDV95DRAFT_646999 [Massariosphaeria phaeospora]